MTAPNLSTCSPWATPATEHCSQCDDYQMDATLLEDSYQIASDVLFNLTGRQWPGVCTDTFRPCGSLCGCSGGCDCGLSRVRLPRYPAVDVTSVKVDGTVIAASEYRIDDWRWLVSKRAADGTVRVWPTTQDLSKATTEDDTFEIVYRYGSDPPPGGARMAAVLGCELALACQPETVGECRLPKRLTTITRQGVSMTILDPQSFLDEGRTGLPEVDAWIASVNRGGIPRRASFSSPDTRWAGVRTTG